MRLINKGSKGKNREDMDRGEMDEDIMDRKILKSVVVGFLAVICIYEMISFGMGNTFDWISLVELGMITFVVVVYEIEIKKVREKYQKELELKLEMREKLDAANLHLMTGKMTPHFMHNTLLAIQELCYSDPREAAEAIGIFSKYIRTNLGGIGESNLIPFDKELEHLQLYMAIQEICYEDDIQFHVDIREHDFYLPQFTVEPIIENAVVHGVRKCRRQGIIYLRTWREDNDVMIEVQDNGIGFEVDDEKKSRFSSSVSVVYRIEKVLGGKIEIDSILGEGTTVTLRIPMRERGGEYHD